MEFLKAFEEARELGMTKEEFIPVWELEIRSKQMDRGGGTLFQSMDTSKIQLLEPWQEIKEELHKDFEMNLQYMFNKLLGGQEVQTKQFEQKNDQMQYELSKLFEIVNSHISNAVEAQTNALRLFLMQEVNMFEQDLKKVIESKCEGQDTLLMPVAASSQTQAISQDFHVPCEKTSGSGSKKYLDSIKSRSNQQKQVQQQKDVPETVYGVCLDKKNGKPQRTDLHYSGQEHEISFETTNQNLPLKSKSNHAFLQLNTHDNAGIKSSLTSTPLNVSSANVSAAVPLKQYSELNVEDFFKEVEGLHSTIMKSKNVASRIRNNKILDKNEVDKNPAFSTVSDSKARCEISEGRSVIKYIPATYATFTIENSDTFATKCDLYNTPFYYTKSEACKVRLCLKFNVEHRLNVFLLVSNGRYDNSKKWPISFECCGLIYNETSQTYTKLWNLGPIMCNKPEPGKENAFKAVVNLHTLRNSHPNVTYQTLCDKGYSEFNHLAIQWSLSALEHVISG